MMLYHHSIELLCAQSFRRLALAHLSEGVAIYTAVGRHFARKNLATGKGKSNEVPCFSSTVPDLQQLHIVSRFPPVSVIQNRLGYLQTVKSVGSVCFLPF